MGVSQGKVTPSSVAVTLEYVEADPEIQLDARWTGAYFGRRAVEPRTLTVHLMTDYHADRDEQDGSEEDTQDIYLTEGQMDLLVEKWLAWKRKNGRA